LRIKTSPTKAIAWEITTIYSEKLKNSTKNGLKTG